MLCTVLVSTQVLANEQVEEGTSVPDWTNDLLETLGADGKFHPDRAIDFSILPGPFYSPETSLGIGVSAVGLYQVDKKDTVSQLSSLIINGYASLNGALGLSIENKTFLDQDKLRFYLDAEVADAPDVYYGKGYDNNHQDSNKVEFDSRNVALTPSLRKRVSERSLIGVGVDLSYAAADAIKPAEDLGDSQVDSKVNSSDLADSSRSIGVDILFNYDSRDSVLSPSDGRLIELDSRWYRQELGSHSDFYVQSLLYCEYLTVGRGADVLAWQLRGRFTQGDVPWDQLSKLGGGSLLRGYNSGRYRDEQMLLAQIEYRLDLPGRHGMVFWGGAGTVAAEVNKFSVGEILPTVGMGYRFQVKPRVNLRLDMGFGDGESGFYFNVNESF